MPSKSSNGVLAEFLQKIYEQTIVPAEEHAAKFGVFIKAIDSTLSQGGLSRKVVITCECAVSTAYSVRTAQVLLLVKSTLPFNGDVKLSWGKEVDGKQLIHAVIYIRAF